jgi:aminopeptidase N
MKRILPLKFLFLSLIVCGQNYKSSFDDIIKSEKKVSSQMLNYKVNANTGNYDLKYCRLEITLDPNVASIAGDITSYFEAKENMTEITFDLADNMTVSQVMQRGNPLSFLQNANEELVITLPATLNQGVLDSLTVTYSGTPISSGFDSFEQSTHNGDPIIWTLSEPYGARDWWPCKQDLNDKIDEIDVYITTPQNNPSAEEYYAVSNGLEQSQVINAPNKTTHFKHQFPIPAYLIALAVTNYSIYTHTVPNGGNPFDIVNYVYPENLVSAQTSTAITVNIMELFSTLFEEYPYSAEKYGHAQFGWGGGMEHTTVSFMGSFGRNLIAHELAHQWFGDKITCGSWKDIWLNEGFATYLSGLVIEDFDGNGAFTTWKQQRNSSITSQTSGAVYLTDADTTNVSRIFDGRLTYNKGSMVLHMLRKTLGDVNFYQGVQDYLSDSNLAYDYAKTADFIPIMEVAGGEDLSEFFNDWLYNQGYPSYTVVWDQPNASQVRFVISQTQSHGSVSFFEAPVPLRVYGTLGEVLDVVLDHTSDGQEFFEAVTFTVSSVEFDPEADLISKNNSVTLSSGGFQLEKDFKLFPNPASSHVFIQKPESIAVHKIKILNILGQTVKEQAYKNSIDISQLSSGLHFIRLETDKGVVHKSMLKH